MTRIGLISDTHGWLDEMVFEHFKNCDEVWHAGDFGEAPPILPEGEGKGEDRLGDGFEHLQSYGDLFVQKFEELFGRKIIFRGVYGNIDIDELRIIYPEKLFFTVEGVNVFMQHIGGYPGRYSKGVKEDIILNKSNLFISGHSHILKIMYDDKLQCLHMNPGAAGRHGWHKMRTIIRFSIDGEVMKDCEVIELGERAKI
ncbi:MAG: metallophosphoesterase family protein [Ferruginibacter sp.]